MPSERCRHTQLQPFVSSSLRVEFFKEHQSDRSRERGFAHELRDRAVRDLCRLRHERPLVLAETNRLHPHRRHPNGQVSGKKVLTCKSPQDSYVGSSMRLKCLYPESAYEKLEQTSGFRRKNPLFADDRGDAQHTRARTCTRTLPAATPVASGAIESPAAEASGGAAHVGEESR